MPKICQEPIDFDEIENRLLKRKQDMLLKKLESANKTETNIEKSLCNGDEKELVIESTSIISSSMNPEINNVTDVISNNLDAKDKENKILGIDDSNRLDDDVYIGDYSQELESWSYMSGPSTKYTPLEDVDSWVHEFYDKDLENANDWGDELWNENGLDIKTSDKGKSLLKNNRFQSSTDETLDEISSKCDESISAIDGVKDLVENLSSEMADVRKKISLSANRNLKQCEMMYDNLNSRIDEIAKVQLNMMVILNNLTKKLEKIGVSHEDDCNSESITIQHT